MKAPSTAEAVLVEDSEEEESKGLVMASDPMIEYPIHMVMSSGDVAMKGDIMEEEIIEEHKDVCMISNSINQ